MLRTHTCGDLKLSHVGEVATLCGWIQTIRKFGGITFIDLRDRYGITQLVFEEEILENNENLGREYVLQVSGNVRERSNKNKNISTGEIELLVSHFSILNASKVPPFTILDDTDGGEELRMEYRFLDLRRNANQNNLIFRNRVTKLIRDFLTEKHFLDIETPFLIKSTPEGARDFIVPSRIHQGQFYALPQSPQTFKQLLMVSGYDRYMQIVKCFRDEDLRADRQPEFTQIDCEMSFVEQEDVLTTFEGLMKFLMKQLFDKKMNDPFKRMTWDEAMAKYGNDKPDTRFDMLINTITKQAQGKGFNVFDSSEVVLSITFKNGNELFTRKTIDTLTEWVKSPQIGCKGLAYIRYHNDDEVKSSFDKFLSKHDLLELLVESKAEKGDIVFILAGKEKQTLKAMGELRLKLGKEYNLIKPNEYHFLWIVDFPLLEYDDITKNWQACHHPFTAPKEEHKDFLTNDKQKENIKAQAYDLILNGNEIGGGSIRIHHSKMQQKMFNLLGISKEEQEEKFRFLLKAFEYGAPPHGGIAFGLDRICAVLKGQDSIRDFIAFPKNNSGRDVMLNSPTEISKEQLTELGINIAK